MGGGVVLKLVSVPSPGYLHPAKVPLTIKVLAQTLGIVHHGIVRREILELAVDGDRVPNGVIRNVGCDCEAHDSSHGTNPDHCT